MPTGAARAAATRRMRVIWNPNAGRKGGVPLNRVDAAGLREALERHELPGDFVETTSEDQARAAVREAVAGGVDIVVAAGGDGTARLIANELLDGDVALGILPLGSAMNLARSVGIPRDLDQAVDILAGGQLRRIDVGEVNGRPFYETVSIGLGAELFEKAQEIDRGQFGSFVGLLRVVARHRPVRVRLELDDHELAVQALMITIANGPYTGLGFTLAPDARLDDGLLDIRIARHFSKRELLVHFWSIAFGRRAFQPHVETRRATRVRVVGRIGAARADGFEIETGPLDIRVRRHALAIVVPAGYTAA